MSLQRSNVFAALCVCSCETRGWGVHTDVVHARCNNNLCVREEYGLVFVLLAIPVAVPCRAAAQVYFWWRFCSAGVHTPMLLTQSCTMALHVGLLSDEFCGMALLWISSFHCPFFTTPWVLSVLWGQSVRAVTLQWQLPLLVTAGHTSVFNSTCVFPWHISQNAFAAYSFSSLNVLTMQGIFLFSFHMSGKILHKTLLALEVSCWSGCSQGSQAALWGCPSCQLGPSVSIRIKHISSSGQDAEERAGW